MLQGFNGFGCTDWEEQSRAAMLEREAKTVEIRERSAHYEQPAFDERYGVTVNDVAIRAEERMCVCVVYQWEE